MHEPLHLEAAHCCCARRIARKLHRFSARFNSMGDWRITAIFIVRQHQDGGAHTIDTLYEDGTLGCLSSSCTQIQFACEVTMDMNYGDIRVSRTDEQPFTSVVCEPGDHYRKKIVLS